MTSTEVSKSITKTSSALIRALEVRHKINRDLFNAKIDLANERNRVLNRYSDDPKTLGNNAEARNAAVDKMIADELDEVKQLEFQLMQADVDYHVAQLRHDESRYMLRIFEAESRMDRAAV